MVEKYYSLDAVLLVSYKNVKQYNILWLKEWITDKLISYPKYKSKKDAYAALAEFKEKLIKTDTFFNVHNYNDAVKIINTVIEPIGESFNICVFYQSQLSTDPIKISLIELNKYFKSY